MIHPTLSKKGRILFAPIIRVTEFMGNHFPVTLVKWRYVALFKKKLNLKNPQDINEKILWAKLYSDTSRWTELADKYKVRQYVEELGLGKHLVKLYAVWTDAKEVNFDALPESFIIKANNGDGKGTNKIIRNKSLQTQTDRQQLIKTINQWLKRKNIGALHAEPQYKDIPPRVIAEELLPLPKGATSLTDYKIWCFHGKAHYIWTCSERSNEGNSAHVMTYDREWNSHPEYSVFNSDYLKGEPMPKPKNLEKMLTIAEKLSAGFPELRVDLYNIEPDQEDGHIYFGEYTFYDWGGMQPFKDNGWDERLGSWITLPEKRI
jgi:hypothetical protein